MYLIASLSQKGIKPLDSFFTYSEADDQIDMYWDKYPNAYLEIVNSDDLNGLTKDAYGFYS